jgi:hypothetical protein
LSKIGFDLANIDTICDMGSVLDGDGSVHMGINYRERTDVFGVKIFCCFMIENEAFITWLVVTAFPVCTSKVVINYNLKAFL